MATLSPYIYSNDAREQADFYVGVFGGEISSIQTYGDLPRMKLVGFLTDWQMLVK